MQSYCLFHFFLVSVHVFLHSAAPRDYRYTFKTLLFMDIRIFISLSSFKSCYFKELLYINDCIYWLRLIYAMVLYTVSVDVALMYVRRLINITRKNRYCLCWIRKLWRVIRLVDGVAQWTVSIKPRLLGCV